MNKRLRNTIVNTLMPQAAIRRSVEEAVNEKFETLCSVLENLAAEYHELLDPNVVVKFERKARHVGVFTLDADVLVFASPIYYYEMCGQLKTLLDRSNPLYGSDYAFTDVYFLSAAAEDGEGVDERALTGLGGWIACFERAHLAGSVFAGGVSAPGEIKGHPALEKAREMGRRA